MCGMNFNAIESAIFDASRSTSSTSAARPATPRPPAGDDEF
jgi:hypothetical protein